MKTTLNAVREHGPCAGGWVKYLRAVKKTKADDEPFNVADILNSNDLDDTLWTLRAVKGYDREMRGFAVWCAEQIKHLMIDPRSVEAVNVSSKYLDGLATDAELAMAIENAEAAQTSLAQIVTGHFDGATVDVTAVSQASVEAAMAAKWAAKGNAAETAWAVNRATNNSLEIRKAQIAKLQEICQGAQ